MNMNFSLIIPTRNHVELINRLFESIVETTYDLSGIEIILYIDDDDTESIKINHPLLFIKKIIGSRQSMSGMTQECFKNSRGKYIFLLNDDVVFRTEHWDTKVLEVFQRFDDEIALVYGNDMYYKENMATFPIMTRKVCEIMDNICVEEYLGHCIDPHILDTFKRLEDMGQKRIIYLDDVIFEHMHYDLGVAVCENDRSHREDNDDKKIFHKLAKTRERYAEKMYSAINESKEENNIQKENIKSFISIILTVDSLSFKNGMHSIYSLNKERVDFEVIVICKDKESQDCFLPKKGRHKIKEVIFSEDLNEDRLLKRAVLLSRGDYVLFLDGNLYPKNGYFKKIFMELKNNPSAEILRPMYLHFRNGFEINMGDNYLNGKMFKKKSSDDLICLLKDNKLNKM